MSQDQQSPWTGPARGHHQGGSVLGKVPKPWQQLGAVSPCLAAEASPCPFSALLPGPCLASPFPAPSFARLSPICPHTTLVHSAPSGAASRLLSSITALLSTPGCWDTLLRQLQRGRRVSVTPGVRTGPQELFCKRDTEGSPYLTVPLPSPASCSRLGCPGGGRILPPSPAPTGVTLEFSAPQRCRSQRPAPAPSPIPRRHQK